MYVNTETTPLGVKYDQEKPDYSLIPPMALEAVVQVLTYGKHKYGRDNWKAVDGFEDRYFAATNRHLWEVRKGNSIDPESNLHHYAHAICSLMFLLESELTSKKAVDTMQKFLTEKILDPNTEI